MQSLVILSSSLLELFTSEQSAAKLQGEQKPSNIMQREREREGDREKEWGVGGLILGSGNTSINNEPYMSKLVSLLPWCKAVSMGVTASMKGDLVDTVSVTPIQTHCTKLHAVIKTRNKAKVSDEIKLTVVALSLSILHHLQISHRYIYRCMVVTRFCVSALAFLNVMFILLLLKIILRFIE